MAKALRTVLAIALLLVVVPGLLVVAAAALGFDGFVRATIHGDIAGFGGERNAVAVDLVPLIISLIVVTIWLLVDRRDRTQHAIVGLLIVGLVFGAEYIWLIGPGAGAEAQLEKFLPLGLVSGPLTGLIPGISLSSRCQRYSILRVLFSPWYCDGILGGFYHDCGRAIRN